MRILCIDDDKDFLFILKKFLGKNNFDSTIVESQSAFFESFHRQRPDLCLIDINLDKSGEGKQIVEKLKHIDRANTPIFALSRIQEQKEIDEIISLGANDFISKPLDEYILTNKIGMLTEERKPSQFMSPLPSGMQNCFLETSLKIVEINNSGIILTSENSILVGSEIIITQLNPLFYGLENKKFRIAWVSKEKQGYTLGIDFNEDDLDIIAIIKANIIDLELAKGVA